jgi:6-phosphofructokinase 2
VISGGLPPGTPPEFSARLAAVGAGLGARVVLDTHDEPLRAALESGAVTVVKPNVRELLAVAAPEGDEPPLEEVAGTLLGRAGLEAVVVSLGADGALLVTPEGTERIAAPEVPVRSRIGAGDSLVAGLSLRLLQGKGIEEAAAYGVAAGTAAVMTPGTELCRREDADRLFESMG